MTMISIQGLTETRFVVIVPTRNRQNLLHELIENLNDWVLIPTAVIIVDSSDRPLTNIKIDAKFPIKIIFSALGSAAHQRNLGIEVALSEFHNLAYLFFMDDDVRTLSDYPLRCISTFELVANKDVVGVSGVTNENKPKRKLKIASKKISRLFLYSGKPSTITRAVVNVAPSKTELCSDAEWLIGCSAWRIKVAQKGIRFEEDFAGQSLFEDVIFSWRAKSLGRLVCNPEIKLEHFESTLARPNLNQHYKSWVVNRFRIFTYGFPSSKFWFFFLNFLLCCRWVLPSIFGNSSARLKFLGIWHGTKLVLKEVLR